MDLMDRRSGYWEGSAAELLHEMTPDSGEEKGIPKTAKWLSTELVRIAPVMRNVGIDIVKRERREPGTGRRIFMLKRTGPKSCEDRCEDGVSSSLFCEDRAGVDSDRPF